jgi:hypothetical protein
MTVILALTEEQENRLTQAAKVEGVDTDRLLRRLVDGVLDQIAPPIPAEIAPRTPGLHTGRYRVAEDFEAPLPDAFWLGGE